MVSFHSVGANYPAFADIKRLVIDAGKSQTPAAEFGQELYNRGVYNAVIIAEAIATAQKITGKKVVNAEDVRRGLENLSVDAARLKQLGLDGFAGSFKTTCADHNSHSAAFVQQWDGAKWVKTSNLITPDSAKVQPLLDEAAKAYAEKNAGWPARTEPCDNQ
jgi:branched-chain amino acid transport system substrate-binding protein